ncbi:uroporphyrinogen-III synthase [Leucobacter sp.]
MTTAPADSNPSGEGDLVGRRILVPRGGAQGERLAAGIRARGGVPVIAPLTVTAPPEDPAALVAAAERWNRGDYDWLVVTSAAGAAAIAEAGARPGRAPVAAVGPATAEALRARGFTAALVPERDFSAGGLSAALLAVLADEHRRLLLPLSALASTELESALTAAGHDPERVAAYRTLPAPRDPDLEAEVAAGGLDAILATSGSGAREIARRFAPLPRSTALVAIGEPTARALAEHGLRPDAVARTHTGPGLLDALAALPAPGSASSWRSGDPGRSGPPRRADLAGSGESAPAHQTLPPARPEGSPA